MKVSILSFYGSLFATPSFRLAKRLVVGFCLMWCVAVTAIVIFQCHPVEAAWDPLRTIKTNCVPFGNFIVASELTNALLDIAIICLPIRMIAQLQMPTRQKWTIGGIFLLGSL